VALAPGAVEVAATIGVDAAPAAGTPVATAGSGVATAGRGVGGAGGVGLASKLVGAMVGATPAGATKDAGSGATSGAAVGTGRGSRQTGGIDRFGASGNAGRSAESGWASK